MVREETCLQWCCSQEVLKYHGTYSKRVRGHVCYHRRVKNCHHKCTTAEEEPAVEQNKALLFSCKCLWGNKQPIGNKDVWVKKGHGLFLASSGNFCGGSKSFHQTLGRHKNDGWQSAFAAVYSQHIQPAVQEKQVCLMLYFAIFFPNFDPLRISAVRLVAFFVKRVTLTHILQWPPSSHWVNGLPESETL